MKQKTSQCKADTRVVSTAMDGMPPNKGSPSEPQISIRLQNLVNMAFVTTAAAVPPSVLPQSALYSNEDIATVSFVPSRVLRALCSAHDVVVA